MVKFPRLLDAIVQCFYFLFLKKIYFNENVFPIGNKKLLEVYTLKKRSFINSSGGRKEERAEKQKAFSLTVPVVRGRRRNDREYGFTIYFLQVGE